MTFMRNILGKSLFLLKKKGRIFLQTKHKDQTQTNLRKIKLQIEIFDNQSN